MSPTVPSNSAFRDFRREVSRELSAAVKRLIEEKHIYQRLHINIHETLRSFREKVPADLAIAFNNSAAGVISERIRLSLAPPEHDDDSKNPALFIALDTVKTFCRRCDSREVAAMVWARDLVGEIERPNAMGRPQHRSPATHQVFVFACQCQRCKGEYDVYTVRRANWHFSLDGRSPMEQVETPNSIPKAERDLFRDALIASHGGKILAALFYLRCFIEQFARRQTGVTGKATGDEIMSAYAATLPPQQRDLMPSLKQQYDSLSEAIHSVREDAELFERSRKDVEKHFEIRRVFEIPERAATPPG